MLGNILIATADLTIFCLIVFESDLRSTNSHLKTYSYLQNFKESQLSEKNE
jgi:hypothetical protein